VRWHFGLTICQFRAFRDYSFRRRRDDFPNCHRLVGLTRFETFFPLCQSPSRLIPFPFVERYGRPYREMIHRKSFSFPFAPWPSYLLSVRRERKVDQCWQLRLLSSVRRGLAFLFPSRPFVAFLAKSKPSFQPARANNLFSNSARTGSRFSSLGIASGLELFFLLRSSTKTVIPPFPAFRKM